MDRFWDEFNRSTITSGILALLVWGVIAYLAIVGKDLPDALTVGGGSIIGYFFAAKSSAQSARANLARERELQQVAEEARCECKDPLGR